jgi:hypothetical protein
LSIDNRPTLLLSVFCLIAACSQGNVPPHDPHWPARSSTWLQLAMPNASSTRGSGGGSEEPLCPGFISEHNVQLLVFYSPFLQQPCMVLHSNLNCERFLF